MRSIIFKPCILTSAGYPWLPFDIHHPCFLSLFWFFYSASRTSTRPNWQSTYVHARMPWCLPPCNGWQRLINRIIHTSVFFSMLITSDTYVCVTQQISTGLSFGLITKSLLAKLFSPNRILTLLLSNGKICWVMGGFGGHFLAILYHSLRDWYKLLLVSHSHNFRALSQAIGGTEV